MSIDDPAIPRPSARVRLLADTADPERWQVLIVFDPADRGVVPVLVGLVGVVALGIDTVAGRATGQVRTDDQTGLIGLSRLAEVCCAHRWPVLVEDATISLPVAFGGWPWRRLVDELSTRPSTV